MRPIELELSAFGSYAGTQTIRFDNIDAGLFLITGDTGSGKTTIFDAMMYALYDETSGGRRDGRMMRSQYAKNTDKTYVRFRFRYGSHIYCVTRGPEYYREAKRKAGAAQKLVREASFVELEMPDGSVYNGNKKEVDRKIEEIVGLTARQFLQVAMLAQGDFMCLLYAKSDERREIFSRLFATTDYQNVQKNLTLRYKQVSAGLEDNRKGFLQYLENILADGELLAECDKLLSQNAVDGDSALSLLARLIEADSVRQKNCTDEIGRLEAEVSRLTGALSSAEADNKLLSAYTAALEQREKLQKDEISVRNLADALYRDIAAQQCRLTALSKNKEDAKLEYDRQSGELSAAIARLEESIPQYEELEQKCYAALDLEYRITECKVEQIRAASDSVRLLENAVQEQADSQSTYEAAAQAYEQARLSYESAYAALLREQAGIIAQSLKDGEACPVCGSVTHPAPAVCSDNTLSEEFVKKEKKVRDTAEAKRDAARDNAVKVQSALRLQQAQTKELLEKCGCAEGYNFAADYSAAADSSSVADYVTLMETLTQKQKAFRDISEKLAQQLAGYSQQYSEYDNTQSDQDTDCAILEQRLAALRAEITEKRRTLSYADADEARARLADYSSRRQQLEAQVQATAKAYADADSVCVQDRAKLSAISEYKAGEETSLERAEYEQFLLSDSQKESYIKTILMHSSSLKDNASRLELLAAQTKDLVYTDSNKLSEEIKQKQSSLKNLRQQYDLISAHLYNNSRIRDNIKKTVTDRGMLEQEYQVINALYSVACASGVKVKMDFETFVLRRYFEQIVYAANRRLVKMNDGQWILKCRTMDSLGSGNAKVGLDLDIHSYVTNSDRDVRTLSGGEGFMAALAMALGLSDVIQSRTSRITLDMMFIDEGFGSLDERSREQAIAILKELAGSSSLIGIISHVSELKEQLDRHLFVTKTGRGSRAEWEV